MSTVNSQATRNGHEHFGSVISVSAPCFAQRLRENVQNADVDRVMKKLRLFSGTILEEN